MSIKENYCEQSRVDFPLGTRTMEIKTKSQTAVALEQAMLHLERVQHVLATLRRGAADKLQEARRLSENDLRRLLTNLPWPPKEGKASSFLAPLFDASN